MSLADSFVTVKPDVRGFQSGLDSGLSRVNTRKHGVSAGSQYTAGFGSSLKRLAGIATAAFGAVKVVGFFKDSLAEAQEAEVAGRRTAQAIKTTGGAAKVSQKQIEDLSNALSRKVGVDDEEIQAGANLLLTFKNVRNEMGKGNQVFTRATTLAQDMTKALGIGLTGANKLLGKALNDPVKGMTALSRAGVTFTAEQKEQITTLVKSGRTLDAQKLILSALEGRYAGAGEAGATAADKAKVAWANLKESMGNFVLPVLNKMAGWFTDMLTEWDKGVGAAGALRAALQSIGVVVVAVGGFFMRHQTLIRNLAVAIAALVVVTKLHAAAMAVQAAGGIIAWLSTYLQSIRLVQVATKAWAAVQWLLNAALVANPIGIVIVAVAALAGSIIYLWKTNATFRANVTKDWAYIREHWDILVANFKLSILSVKGKWAELQLAISGAKRWFRELKENIATTWQQIKDVFREGVRVVVMFFYDMVGKVLDGAVKAFGWIPGIGTKLRTAAAKFNKFKDDVNRALSKVEDKDVTLRAKFEATKGPGGWTAGIKLGATGGEVSGGTKGKDSVPYLLMPGEFIIDRKGNNLADAMAYFGVPGMARGGRAERFRAHGITPSAGAVQRKVDTKFTQMFTAVGTRAMNALAPILAGWTSGVGGVGAGVQRWAGVVLQVLQMLHQSASWLPVVLRRMQQESGGNQYAINLWDINARRGDPSRGLMQTIGSTFAAYAGSLRNRGIYDPLANIYAGLNYALHRYGSLSALTRPGGYDLGGILHPGALGLNRTNRPERILSPDQTVLFDRLVARLEGRASDRAASVLRLHPDDIRAIGAELRAGMAGANYASGRQAGLMARTV